MSENNELVLLQNARTALSQVSTFDDAREIRDKADAVRHYARQAKLGQELVVEAAVLKLRAERRLGEILRETQLATGVEGNQHADIPGEPNGVLLSELGISKSESSRMQRIAELAKEVFETYVRTELESQREPTITGVMRLVRESKPVNAKPVGAPETKCKSVASLDELLRSGLRFKNILINTRSATASYEQLETLPILQLLDESGAAYLWTSTERLLETLDLADAWELSYRGMELFVPPRNLTPEQSPHLLVCFQQESSQCTESRESSWIVCPQLENDGVPLAVYRYIETSQPGLALGIHTQSLPQGEHWSVYGNPMQ
jgi:hypothetical protein